MTATWPGRATREEYLKHLREAWKLTREVRRVIEQAQKNPSVTDGLLILGAELAEKAMREIEKAAKQF